MTWLKSASRRATGRTAWVSSSMPTTSQPPRELANEAMILGTLRWTEGVQSRLNSSTKPSSRVASWERSSQVTSARPLGVPLASQNGLNMLASRQMMRGDGLPRPFSLR